MADKIHRGDAVAVAQVWRATPANVEAGDQFQLTINGKLGVTFTATAATVANVTAGLVDAWNDSVISEFTEITAADAGTHVTLTASTAGTPFLVTASTTDGSGGEVAIVETTPGVAVSNEVQRITLSGTYTGGTFTLTWDLGSGDETTAAIAYNATADTVQTAIEGLASVVSGDVIVTGGPGPNTAWFVTWTGNFAATEVAEGSVDGTNLTGNATVEVATVTQGSGDSNEIVMLSLLDVTSGTYTITFGGETTGNLNWNAAAATIQAALEALPTIGSGNIEVYGGKNNQGPSAGDHYTFFLVFVGDFVGTNVGIVSTTYDDLNGAAVAGVVQAGGQSSQDEWQLIDLGQATAGTFTLTYDGQTTATIDYQATAEELRDALELLSNIASGAIDVYVGGQIADSSATTGGMWGVQFTGALADTDVSLLTMGTGSLTGATSPGVTSISAGAAGIDEIQSVKIFGTGGTFTLTYDGQTTAATAYNASTATLTTNLEALSNVTDVTVTGTGTPADPFLVTFVDPGEENINEMTADASSLTGGGGSVTEATAHHAGTNEVQTITVTATGGTFTLTFGGQTTSAIAFNAAASAVETALESLSTIDGVTVAGSAGGPWTVTFDSATLEKTDVALLTADDSELTGTGTESLTIIETTRSEGPHHFDTARNWNGNRVPDSGDMVYLEDGNIDILYGLRQRTNFTVDAGTDVLTFTSDQVAFVDDQILRVKSSTTLPAGLSANTDYYVINLDHHAGTCQLSTTSGGAAVNITDTGTGTHTIALELEGIKHVMRFTGDGGLSKRTATDYYEYRPDYLEIGIRPGGDKKVLLGVGDGSGSQLFKICTGDYQTEFEIHESGGSREPGLAAIRIKNDNSSSNVMVLGGEVAIAVHAAETSDINKITQRGGQIDIGNETGTVALGELDKTDGTIRARNITFSGNLSA